jgi:IS605 OrfB family transposase
MKLTAQIKLNPTKEQNKFLLDTLKEANTACQEISYYAFEKKVFSKYDLQKQIYYRLKSSFKLSAQMIVRCIGKVADAYKKDKDTKRIFKKYGCIAYDSRILRYKTIRKEVSIWTVNGRQIIPYLIGQRQEKLLKYQQGESDLAYIKGTFYLLATCEIPDENVNDFEDVLGVDFGIVQIATTSDGKSYSGKQTEEIRQWYSNLRAKLQAVGTKSAKRRLKKISGKEAKFKKDTNHKISKELVKVAKDTNRAIAIENLSGIRTRTKVRHNQRAKQSSWAFNQLRSFITYKAQIAGVPVLLVNPQYTSQRCSQCGHIEKANRKSQSEFVCRACVHSSNADFNGALNIRLLGRGQSAYGSDFSFEKSVTSPPALAVGN